MGVLRRFPLQFAIFFTFQLKSASGFASCKSCDTTFGSYECQNNCIGETCFILHNLVMESPERYMRQGCLFGAQTSPGCRVNQDGYTLCICLDDECNSLENATLSVAEKSSVELDSIACRQSSNSSAVPSSRRTRQRPCAGSYCTFQGTQVTPFASPPETTEKRDCSLVYDFDVFTTASKFFFYPESCAVEEFAKGMTKTTCVCSQPSCNTNVMHPVDRGEVLCHMSEPPLPKFNSSHEVDEQDDGDDVCQGDFCVHLLLLDGSFYRGCLSLNQSTSDRQIGIGFYKHYLGWEERICDTDYCNSNVTSVEASWPEELAEFRRRSSILPHTAYPHVSAAPSNVPSIMSLFTLLLCLFP